MVTRIVLIRHASTDTGSRLCGSFDVALSPAGQRQLREMIERPAHRAAPDALFTSTLARARQVADALAPVWMLRPQSADWAREIHCGELEGIPLQHLQREFPELWLRNEAQADETFAWPGGESYAGFRARIRAGVKAVAEAHAGGRIAIVTHAGVVSQVLGIIRRRPAAIWAADRPDPLTATEVLCEDGAPSAVLTFNDPDWY